MAYGLVLKNAEVVDPSQGRNETPYVAVAAVPARWNFGLDRLARSPEAQR